MRDSSCQRVAGVALAISAILHLSQPRTPARNSSRAVLLSRRIASGTNRASAVGRIDRSVGRSPCTRRSDPPAGPSLRDYLTLTENRHVLFERGWSLQNIFDSRYYWFCRFVNLRVASTGPDPGLEQEAQQIVAHPDCDPDWSVVERVESLAAETMGPGSVAMVPYEAATDRSSSPQWRIVNPKSEPTPGVPGLGDQPGEPGCWNPTSIAS